MYRFLIVSFINLVCLGILSSCASTSVDWDPDDYTVRSGDSLYSIAWRYELDPDDLARWNNLSSPYIIHPGDRLHTRAANDERVAIEQQAQSSTRVESENSGQRQQGQITVRPGDTLYGLAKKNYMPAWKLAMINNLKPPYALHPGQKLKLKDSAAASRSKWSSKTSSKKVLDKKAPANSVSVTNAKVAWRWPIRGKIIGKFNRWKNDAKGIDIAGKNGATIKAAASGKVVYSGNSLINYGHLVIIKHSRDYLSAYANNQRLLVKEGDTVKAGQNIAELGKSAARGAHLHFEIRKKGKPVDPLRYLPSS